MKRDAKGMMVSQSAYLMKINAEMADLNALHNRAVLAPAVRLEWNTVYLPERTLLVTQYSYFFYICLDQDEL